MHVLSQAEYFGVGESEPPSVKDPAVAKALAVIHARFAEELDLEVLAREAGVSRSVLGERFVELVGESPMRYCAQWRMRVAADMLRNGHDNCGNVAFAVGFNSEAAFNRAFKREFGVPPITWKRRLGEPPVPAAKAPAGEAPVTVEIVSQRSGTCRSMDGTSIGYTEMGDGPPILMPAVWYHQVQNDWSSPAWRHWIAEAVEGRRLVRSDIRGAGMSDRNPTRWTFDALYQDFEAVADAAGGEQFDILAFSHSANIGLAYAARHPGRVRKLVVVGGYARGYMARGDQVEIKRRESLIEFARNYKSGDRAVFAQMLGSLYWPGARGETVDWFGERLATIVTLDEALQDVFRNADVSRDLPNVRAQTLVMHSKGDRIIGFACAEEIVGGVPDARLVALDSDNHVLIGTEPAWQTAKRALREFLRH